MQQTERILFILKNFRSFLNDKKAVKYFVIGLATGILLIAVLLSGLKIGVEIYKAYMRSYYAKTAAMYSAENNNPDENIDSVSNENVSEVPNGLISKNEAERIALSAIKDKKRFPEVADENMILFCSVEDDSLYGNPEYWDTHLIYRPDLSNYYGDYFEEIPEYCWKVELVADIQDWWMPRVTMFINAETGAVSYAKTILPD